MPTITKDGRMPVLFVGHGSPMNAIEDNVWSRAFRSIASQLPRPKAILSVSAHWYVSGTWVTGNSRPETVHDFGGFPEPLYRIQYPAPGGPDLADRVIGVVGGETAKLSFDWGLDHGSWSVLLHLFPDADIPVVQLAIDYDLPPAGHFAIGRKLAPLRDEGILIMGSGNITHNLRHAMTSYQRGEAATPDWALGFDSDTASALEKHDTGFLVHALENDIGRMNHPTSDHYLPLLYAAGAADAGDAVRFPITGFDLSSLSMRAVILG